MDAPRHARDPASPAPHPSATFHALDDCHRRITEHLARLSALAVRLAAAEATPEDRAEAGAIEAFFSDTSRDHHQTEERHVFPPLLDRGDPRLSALIRMLQQDHGWIEENWIELAPKLRAVSQGSGWVDPVEFQHDVAVFTDLCGGHIALEESMVYPQSRAHWTEALTRRGIVAWEGAA